MLTVKFGRSWDKGAASVTAIALKKLKPREKPYKVTDRDGSLTFLSGFNLLPPFGNWAVEN